MKPLRKEAKEFIPKSMRNAIENPENNFKNTINVIENPENNIDLHSSIVGNQVHKGVYDANDSNSAYKVKLLPIKNNYSHSSAFKSIGSNSIWHGPPYSSNKRTRKLRKSSRKNSKSKK